MIDKKTIFDSGTKDILAFAKKEAGLTFPDDAGRDYIISQVFEAMGWDAYKPEDDATHVVVRLPLTKDNKHPYVGGFNGKMFTIKRGVDVEIPVGYYNTMIDAAAMRFRIENLDPNESNISEGGNAHKRIPMGELEITVKQFLNKGSKAKPEAPKAKAPVEIKAASGE